MTKLLQWVSVVAVVALVWVGAYTDRLLPHYKTELLWSPVVLLALIGVFSVLTIAYRVATFNDCEEASKELQQQISEAREDLRRKGFNFEEKPAKKTD